MNARRTFLRASVFAAAAFGALLASLPAHAKGDASGTLGSGGVARGDISMDVGETDRITVDLDAGALLDVTFTSGFTPQLVFTDPDGAPVDLGVEILQRVRVRGFAISRTGTYQFAVSSADGSQGAYSLVVRQKWARSFPIEGLGTATVDVPMPLVGRIGCTVNRAQGAPGQPRIVSLRAPSGDELLAAPIEPRRNTARLTPVPTSLAGVYTLSITSTDGTSAWAGKVTRTAARVRPAKLLLANGIDQVSYATDGVGELFSRRCGNCHAWAKSYAGVRAYARKALPKIRTGNMPPDGARLSGDQISLIQSWIDSGFGR